VAGSLPTEDFSQELKVNFGLQLALSWWVEGSLKESSTWKTSGSMDIAIMQP